MKHNGTPRGHNYLWELTATDAARTASEPVRLSLLAWLQRWKHCPGRTFWELDTDTGQWRRI